MGTHTGIKVAHCDWNTGGKLKMYILPLGPGGLSFLRAAGHLKELFLEVTRVRRWLEEGWKMDRNPR